MRTVLRQLIAVASMQRVALARVIESAGGPCPPGTAMVVTASGEVFGCLSGGCIDADVVQRGLDVIAGGAATSVRFGAGNHSDPLQVAPVLTCGGEVEVFIEPVDASAVPLLRQIQEALDAGVELQWATTLTAHPRWRLGEEVGTQQARTFVHRFDPASRLILSGANAFVEALAAMADLAGFRVTVVDAREVFTTSARFPTAEVVVDWPQRYLAAEAAAGRIDARTAICVLTHDDRFDVATLRIAVESPAGFVGALGSRRTQQQRIARLAELGVAASALARLRGPLGLDLNAQTPAQTAVSILAQIISEAHGGTGLALADGAGAIHRPAAG